jgi:mannose-1-phosphate guanylyltransferase
MTATKFQPHRCSIILAGGEGKRLQPFVRNLMGFDLPKQYVCFTGTRSMLEHTFDRTEQLLPRERIFTVVNRDHLRYAAVRNQMRSRSPRTVVVQPVNRETGPGLLLALVHLFRQCPDSTVAVFPSDHFILREDRFIANVQLAFENVESCPAKIVLLGVEPTDIEPEYGYILPEYDSPDALSAVQDIKTFIEKPEPQKAARAILSGALWNTMVMVFRPRIFLRLVGLTAPDLYRTFRRIYQTIGTSRELSTVEMIYEHLQPVNLSKDLLENFSRYSRNQLSVISMKDVFWSDWGSESRIVATLKRLRRLPPLTGGILPDNACRQLPMAFESMLGAGL